MRRTALLSAATATVLAASMLTGSAVAQADTAPGGGPVLDDADAWYAYPGMLFVTAHSDNPITHITAHFSPVGSQDGTAQAGSTEDFTQQSGADGRSGIWRAPVHLAELGEYRVTVDLEDSSGAKVTGVLSPQTLQYQTILTIPDFSVTPTRPDYLHQKVTAEGTVFAEDPRHPDASVPAGDLPVGIASRFSRIRTKTGADGHFVASFLPTVQSDDLQAYPDGSSAYPGAILLGTSEQDITVVQAPTRFTASTHALDLRQGTTGTVTGRAEVQTADGWQPLPHAELGLFGLGGPNGTSQFVAAETTTDDHGLYTLRVPSDSPAPTGELALEPTPFQQTAVQAFSLHVAYTTHLDMAATLGDDSRLHVSGWMYYSDQRAHWPKNPAVVIEYSKDGKTGWKTASTLPVKLRYNKANFEEDFGASFKAPNDAYWRARFDGNPDLAGSTTTPAHLRRYATRITGFNVSPEPIRKNGLIHLAGTLQYLSGTTWKPLTDDGPDLYFRPRGASAYHYVSSLGTDSKGRIANVVLKATQDGTWAVAFNRSTGSRYLKSPMVTDYVDVR
ncbi:hypothetical protein ACFYXJ_14920 [Streptomyces sp. NPDC002667]|uniref:hypothetical protein n=1 Tax=Streptomyces sp. NPDC002667 TaxID=3364657 RepID=UPI0036AF47C4